MILLSFILASIYGVQNAFAQEIFESEINFINFMLPEGWSATELNDKRYVGWIIIYPPEVNFQRVIDDYHQEIEMYEKAVENCKEDPPRKPLFSNLESDIERCIDKLRIIKRIDLHEEFQTNPFIIIAPNRETKSIEYIESQTKAQFQGIIESPYAIVSKKSFGWEVLGSFKSIGLHHEVTEYAFIVNSDKILDDDKYEDKIRYYTIHKVYVHDPRNDKNDIEDLKLIINSLVLDRVSVPEFHEIAIVVMAIASIMIIVISKKFNSNSLFSNPMIKLVKN